MPAYNFQAQFVSAIADGSKKQTIRKRRKYPTRAGQMLQLYMGQRTKNCKMIVVRECTAVVPVVIDPANQQIALDGKWMTNYDDIIRFSKADGFDDSYDFFAFFKRYPTDVLEHELEVIYWK